MPANYVLLERIELNASAASVTFNNIPQSGYTDLKFVMSARQSTAAVAADVLVTFNGSTSSNSNRYLYGDSASAGSGSNGYTPSSNYIAIGVGNNATANTFGSVEMYIPNYLSSNNKSFSVDSVGESNATSSVFQFMLAGLWSSSAAINQITVTPASSQSFLQYSTFSLYGLAATGTTPVIAPKATGGNITTDGTYWIHTFNSTGVFTPSTALSCDYLVVAGGGGGGGDVGGGGGAGGFRTGTSLAVTTSAYTITVGAGGTAGSAGGSSGGSGSNSVFDTITSTGGGAGGGYTLNGGNGGSGGGGGTGNSVNGAAGQNGTGTAGQGYDGGDGYQHSGSTNYGSGGGGGSASVGSNASGSDNTAGGSGTSNSYSGSAVTYAAGGSGGGGNATRGAGANATANTGNGAQGAAGGAGGVGGSGIVIIRYLVA